MIQAEMSGEYRGAGRNHLINNDNNDHYHFNDIHASKCLISQNTLASFTGNDIQNMFKLSKDIVFQIELTISSTVANTLLEAFSYLRLLIIEQQLIMIYLKYCCYLFNID